MRSSTRLQSAVFQLTPTRTRCDLVINANGKTEKIATGLVNPFLAHLKAAQDQMAKGGYSIKLVPDNGNDAPWFTKETIERFVRFVSTPEILERVYTLELEILQMDEAIAVQSSGDFGHGTVEDHHMKSLERSEGVHIGKSCMTVTGSKPLPDSSEEKAIVLYQPGAPPPEANESPEDSKLQLKKVLKARKTVLQREQGMAFARAAAAGFAVDQLEPLMSFAESFGGSRMRDACVKFKELWKRKHETGQWVEIEAAEAMSGRPEFSLVNSSGITLATGIAGAEHVSGIPDENATIDQPPPPQGQQGYFQGQIPHPMFSPWPINSPPGTLPVVQGIPMQGIPYYQNYPGNTPFVQQTYASGEDSRVNNAGQRLRRRRHSMDCGDSGYTETETWEVDASRTRSHDDTELDTVKGDRSSSGRKKKSGGTVVIRNLNYITSNRQQFSDDDASQSTSDDQDRDGYSSPSRDYSVVKQKNTNNKEAEDGHWQAFETYLLKDANDETEHENGDLFAMEKATRTKRPVDESLKRDRRTGQLGDGRKLMDAELDGRMIGYRRTSNDDFIIGGQRNHSGYSTEDPLAVNRYENGNADIDRKKSSNQHMDDDDSYIVSLRLPLQYQGENIKGSNAGIDMDSEFVSSRLEISGAIVKYEPDDLALVPERETERGMLGYDPALDYDMEAHAELDGGGTKGKKVGNDVKPGSRKSDKDPRSKPAPDKKKTVGPIRKGKPSKSSPLEEAKARAEKLRSFKADLQKMKKEREEEEMKRLALLKLERQKRIAAKGGSIPAHSIPLQTRKSLPTKLSPISHKSSKFSDSEPGPSSPLQRSSIKHLSSIDSVKASKSSKLSTTGSQSAGNRATRSVSSLPELKKEDNTSTTDTKASMAARIRRLSEPKVNSSHHHVIPAKPRKTELAPSSSVKPKSSEPASKQKLANGPETKKISAIVNHDKSKAASLPELKTRTPKASDVVSLGKVVAATETTQNGNGSKSVVVASDGSGVAQCDNQLPITSTTLHTFEGENVRVQTSNSDMVAEGSSQPSTQHPTLGQLSADQVMTQRSSVAAKEFPKVSNTTSIDEKPYQAPFARNSSLEDPCTRNSEYGKAPPTVLLLQPPPTIGAETLKARVSDPMSLKLEKIPEVIDKSEVKESPKGFRRLLKFARKSHAATSDRNSLVDNMSIKSFEADDGVANAAATTSNEAHNTLKNLISQDETPTAATTPQKSSRHFSLLSPFRSKTSEKKLTA